MKTDDMAKKMKTDAHVKDMAGKIEGAVKAHIVNLRNFGSELVGRGLSVETVMESILASAYLQGVLNGAESAKATVASHPKVGMNDWADLVVRAVKMIEKVHGEEEAKVMGKKVDPTRN